MITEVPTYLDFKEQGLIFLNLAWDTVSTLLLSYADAEEWNGIEEDQSEDYWKAAQKPLGTAIALAHQGAEFLLKSRIVAVSPFLLISRQPRDWPRKCDKQDTDFSAFHTVDAQDLLRMHNTVAKTRLSGEFEQLFEELRKTRNTIFHTVNKKMVFSEIDIIRFILGVSEDLVGSQHWIELRKAYLQTTPDSAAWSSDGVDLLLCREALTLIDLLPAKDLKKHFSFNKRQRKYICPVCTEMCRSVDADLEPKTAQLHPNTRTSTNILCFVCGTNTPVTRSACNEVDCKSNVIHVDDEKECLTCYKSQDGS